MPLLSFGGRARRPSVTGRADKAAPNSESLALVFLSMTGFQPLIRRGDRFI
jgi:hypothetical protein